MKPRHQPAPRIMTLLLNEAIALALYLAPTGAILGMVKVARRRYHRRDRRNPLKRELLRAPGHSVALQLEDHRSDLIALMSATAPVPLFLYAVYRTPTGWAPGAVLGLIFLLGGIVFLAWRVSVLVRETRKLQLGLDAEMAMGQELNNLMREGFWVFHDVQADGPFNVDHVVVGPQGLFAVETKGRPKGARGSDDGYRVVLRDEVLEFPGWREREPLAQARRNAKWLGDWLSSAIGERVEAQPVLALPGWFIERTYNCDVGTINGTGLAGYFMKRRTTPLSVKQVEQIRHQLDARCRDVKALAYAEAKARK